MAKKTAFNLAVLLILSLSVGAQLARSSFTIQSLYFSAFLTLALPVVIFALSGRFRPLIYILALTIAGLNDWALTFEHVESLLTEALALVGIPNHFSGNLFFLLPMVVLTPFALELTQQRTQLTFRYIGVLSLTASFVGIIGIGTPSILLGKALTKHDKQYLLTLGKQILESPTPIPSNLCTGQGYSCIRTPVSSENFEHILYWQPREIVADFKSRPLHGNFEFATTVKSRLLDVGDSYVANYAVVSNGGQAVFLNDVERQRAASTQMNNALYTILLLLTLPLTLESVVRITGLYRASILLRNPKLLLKKV